MASTGYYFGPDLIRKEMKKTVEKMLDPDHSYGYHKSLGLNQYVGNFYDKNSKD